MCYDISFKVKIQELVDYFPDLIFDEQLQLDFDGTHIIGHNYGEHPILYRNNDTGKIHCRSMEWGCIPYYVKHEEDFLKQRASMLNARSERILEDTKSYWYKIRNRRCLIPASAIYEHRAIKSWKKKVPYLIKLKAQSTFFIPGLYSVAELLDKSTGELQKVWTFSLITTSANEVMKHIHNDGTNKNRMPLFVPFEMAKEFLEADLSPEKYQAIMQFEMPADELEYWPVYTIRSPKERPDLKAKDEIWEWENLPALGE